MLVRLIGQETTSSGLYVGEVKSSVRFGTVEAVGSKTRELNVGDKVIMAKYDSYDFKEEGSSYAIISEKGVFCVYG